MFVHSYHGKILSLSLSHTHTHRVTHTAKQSCTHIIYRGRCRGCQHSNYYCGQGACPPNPKTNTKFAGIWCHSITGQVYHHHWGAGVCLIPFHHRPVPHTSRLLGFQTRKQTHKVKKSKWAGEWQRGKWTWQTSQWQKLDQSYAAEHESMKPKCCLLDNNKTSTRVKLNHFIMQLKEEPHGSGGTDKAKTSGQPTKAAQAEVVEEGAKVNALMPTSMKVR